MLNFISLYSRNFFFMAKRKNTDKQSHKKVKRQHIDGCHTLYVKNINSKVNRDKIKHNLYVLFATYADVFQIQYTKRGQAWISVSSIQEANRCIEYLNNFPFFEKDISVQFANNNSSKIKNLLLNQQQ